MIENQMCVCVFEQKLPVRMTSCTRFVGTCVIRRAGLYRCLTVIVMGSVKKAVSAPEDSSSVTQGSVCHPNTARVTITERSLSPTT